MQRLFHAQQLVALAFQHLGHRNAGPLGDHLGHLFLGDLVAQQLGFHLGGLFRLLGGLHLLLQIRDHPVLQLGHAAQVAGAARLLHVHPGLFQLRLVLLGALQGRLLGVPDFLQVGVLFFQRADVVLQFIEPLLAGLVVFLAQRLTLHLELDQATVETVHFLGHGVDLHADTAGRLVDQVDGLVRQLPVGDVAVAEPGGGDDRAVGDVHAVVHLVALFQATQDGDGVLHRGLVHLHLLEAPLQCRVLFNVLAVLVQGGGAHAVQFAPGQGGLEHVAGVHGAVGLAGTDHGVQLVDEQNDAPFLLGEFIQHRFQAFLELAAILGAGDQRRHVQGQHALILEPFRHLAVNDALGQPLDDGGLADAGLADQHRVVLGAALQHLDGAADFIVTADHRIQLAALGPLGEILGVLLQRFHLVFRVGVGDRFTAADFLDFLRQHLLLDAGVLEQLAQFPAVVAGRQQQRLGGHVLVATLLGLAVRQVEQPRQTLGQLHVTVELSHRRQFIHGHFQGGDDIRRVGAGFLQQRRRHPATLLQQCQQ